MLQAVESSLSEKILKNLLVQAAVQLLVGLERRCYLDRSPDRFWYLLCFCPLPWPHP
jgi:hypothetical protein